MAKNKILRNVSLSVLILLIVFGASYFFVQQAFYGKSVYIPQFASLECFGSEKTFDPIPVSWDGQSFTCGQTAKGGNYYANDGCQYVITMRAATLGTIRDCPLNSDACEGIKGFEFLGIGTGVGEFDLERAITISYGRRLYINPDKYLSFGSTGQWIVREKSTVYRLVNRDNGYVTIAPDCRRSSLNNEVTQLKKEDTRSSLVKDLQGFDSIPAGTVQHYITSRSEVESDNVITRPDIEGGEPIYVVGQGYYYKFYDGVDGKKYADTQRSGTIIDSRIECNPADKVYCTSEAKVRTTEQVECGLGTAPGYTYPVGDKICRAKCAGKYQVPTEDCKIVPKGCPADKPFLNPQTLECENSVVVPPPGIDWAKYLPWIVGGIFGLLLLIIILKAGKSGGGQTIMQSTVRRRGK